MTADEPLLLTTCCFSAATTCFWPPRQQAFLSRAVQQLQESCKEQGLPEAAVAQKLRTRGVDLAQLQQRAAEVHRGIAECENDEGWKLIQARRRAVAAAGLHAVIVLVRVSCSNHGQHAAPCCCMKCPLSTHTKHTLARPPGIAGWAAAVNAPPQPWQYSALLQGHLRAASTPGGESNGMHAHMWLDAWMDVCSNRQQLRLHTGDRAVRQV